MILCTILYLDYLQLWALQSRELSWVGASEVDQNPDCGVFGVGLRVSLCCCKKPSSNLLFDEPLSSDCWAPDDPTPTVTYDLHTGKYRNARNNSKRPILYSRIYYTAPWQTQGACEITLSACQTLSWSSCLFTHPTHIALSTSPCGSARGPERGQSLSTLASSFAVVLAGWFTAEPSASVQIQQFKKQKGNQVHPLTLVTFCVRLLRSSLLWDLSVSINFLSIPFLPFQPSSNQIWTWEHQAYYCILKVINIILCCA